MHGRYVYSPAMLLDMAHGAGACMVEAPIQITNAALNHPKRQMASYLECSLALDGNSSIACQGVSCLSATLGSASQLTSKSASAVPKAELQSLRLGQKLSGRRDIIIASIASQLKGNEAGCKAYSAQMDAALSLLSLTMTGSLLSRAEAVNFSQSAHKAISHAACDFGILDLSCSKAGKLMGMDFTGLDYAEPNTDDVPALDLIWHPLTLQKLDPSWKQWLILHRPDVSFEEYFTL